MLSQAQIHKLYFLKSHYSEQSWQHVSNYHLLIRLAVLESFRWFNLQEYLSHFHTGIQIIFSPHLLHTAGTHTDSKIGWMENTYDTSKRQTSFVFCVCLFSSGINGLKRGWRGTSGFMRHIHIFSKSID